MFCLCPCFFAGTPARPPRCCPPFRAGTQSSGRWRRGWRWTRTGNSSGRRRDAPSREREESQVSTEVLHDKSDRKCELLRGRKILRTDGSTKNIRRSFHAVEKQEERALHNHGWSPLVCGRAEVIPSNVFLMVARKENLLTDRGCNLFSQIHTPWIS